MIRFSRDQPSFPQQLGYQFSRKLMAHAVIPVLVAETADLKLFSDNDCDRVCNIKVGPLCSALFQDEVRDLPALCLQSGAVFLIAHIQIFLITVEVITLERVRF